MTRTRWILTALVLCGAAVLAWARLDANAASGPRLITAEVTRGPVVASVATTGTLQPVDTVEVGSQVSGTIDTIGADFNDRVKKGQVIATLDPALIQSQIAQAAATVARLEADLEHAKVDATDADNKLARARALARDQLIAASDLDSAETTSQAAHAAIGSAQAQITQARASLAQNQVSLSHTIIRAPVDGIVLSRNVEVGQTVAAGLQAPVLFLIARDLSQMQVNASVDEAQIGGVAAGQPSTFKVDAYGDETFSGTVRQVRLQPTTVQNVVNYTVVINVANPSLRLKPGMTATINIETGRDDDALRVPAAALRFKPTAEVLAAYGAGDNQGSGIRVAHAGNRAGGARADQKVGVTPGRSTAQDEGGAAAVWVLADGHLHPVRVTPGLVGGSFVQVSGARLQPGAQVVTGFAPATTAAAAAQPSNGSPLVPYMPRRGGSASSGRGR